MKSTLAQTAPARSAPPGPLEAFERFERRGAHAGPPWLRALRTSGISYFGELGFPAAHHEDWRFTTPSVLAERPYVPASRPGIQIPVGASLSLVPDGELEAHRLVFVDGHFIPRLSRVLPLGPDQVVTNLLDALDFQSALVESFLGRAARHETSAFVALNTAFLEDGAFVYLPAGRELAAPVHLLFVSSQPGVVSHPRALVVARDGARAQVIEEYVSLGNQGGFTNAVTEIMAGPGAQVEHIRLQRENEASLHVGTVEARQCKDSRVVSHSISTGARLARHNIHLRFEEPGCEGVLNGLYTAANDQLVDHHTIADHLSPHCQSHEFYHGILGGRSRGVFNGRIYVRRDAQKTDAKQTNRNLLLSSEATVHTKPQLEIWADDVKCTHGATVGQLDENAVFYLRSRGIGEARARRMLIGAFASEVIGRIGVEALRARLDETLQARLAQELAAAAPAAPGPLSQPPHPGQAT